MMLSNKILFLILSLVIAVSVQQDTTTTSNSTVKPSNGKNITDGNIHLYNGPKGDCTLLSFHVKDCAQIVSSLSSQLVATSIKPTCNLTCHNQSLPDHCKTNVTVPEVIVVKQVGAVRDVAMKTGEPITRSGYSKKTKYPEEKRGDYKPVVVGSKLDPSKFKKKEGTELSSKPKLGSKRRTFTTTQPTKEPDENKRR